VGRPFALDLQELTGLKLSFFACIYTPFVLALEWFPALNAFVDIKISGNNDFRAHLLRSLGLFTAGEIALYVLATLLNRI
jgi:hypothetical protein